MDVKGEKPSDAANPRRKHNSNVKKIYTTIHRSVAKILTPGAPLPESETGKAPVASKTSIEWLSTGQAHCQAGEYQDAISACDHAISLDPSSASAYRYRAEALAGLKKYRQALEDFNHAILLDPDASETYKLRGDVFLKLKKYQKALEDFNHTLQLDPTNHALYRQRADIFYFLEKYKNALADYNRALEHNPNDSVAYIRRGHALSLLNEPQKALEDFGKMTTAMFGQLMSGQEDVANVYKVGQNTTRLLLSAGDLMVGYLLLRQAAVALAKLDEEGVSEADRAFYAGKPAVARFFAQTVLPELTARRQVVESTDNALMDVAEASF